jgi:signal peptidase II
MPIANDRIWQQRVNSSQLMSVSCLAEDWCCKLNAPGGTVINSSRVAVLLLTMIGCVGCDQVTKLAARTYLSADTTTSFLGDMLRLQRTENPGAFLSLGDQLAPRTRVLLFTYGGSLLVGAALIWAIRSSRATTMQTIGAALVCSGGLGNLLDRASRHGYVTDFLNVGIGPVRTGIFNVADFALLLGVVMLLMSGSSGERSVPIG